MDYRQLRAFIAVFEERSITAAAQRIHLSQPALSSNIRLLEEDLGTQLFDRRARGVEATEHAKALYPLARRMVAEAESLQRRFRTEQERVPLEVGIESDLAPATVREFIKQATQAIPELLLSLRDGCAGNVRLGCEDLRCEDELFLPIWSDPYVIAMSRDHDLANKTSLEAHDLADACWIMCPQHASHQRFLPLYGSTVSSPAAHATSFGLCVELTCAAIGISIVPLSLTEQNTHLAVHRLPGLDLHRRIGLCFGLHALDNPTIANLHAGLRQSAP